MYDKLDRIGKVFDMFVSRCQQCYSVSEFVTIAEILLAFRGNCSFRQYIIPSKPNKYGIKIFSLVDAKIFYTLNLEVYVGEQPDGPFQVSNSAQDVVKRLCAPTRGTGRNITADNWFTSYNLVTDQPKKYNITYVGTVRKNKRELPPNFVSVRNRERYSGRFAFQKNVTLV